MKFQNFNNNCDSHFLIYFFYVGYIFFYLAIKQGRYTHARRAQYTKEIKGIPLADVKTEAVDCIRVDEGQLNCLLNKLTEVQEKYIPGLRERFPNPEVFHATHKEIYVSV